MIINLKRKRKCDELVHVLCSSLSFFLDPLTFFLFQHNSELERLEDMRVIFKETFEQSCAVGDACGATLLSD